MLLFKNNSFNGTVCNGAPQPTLVAILATTKQLLSCIAVSYEVAPVNAHNTSWLERNTHVMTTSLFMCVIDVHDTDRQSDRSMDMCITPHLCEEVSSNTFMLPRVQLVVSLYHGESWCVMVCHSVLWCARAGYHRQYHNLQVHVGASHWRDRARYEGVQLRPYPSTKNTPPGITAPQSALLKHQVGVPYARSPASPKPGTM